MELQANHTPGVEPGLDFDSRSERTSSCVLGELEQILASSWFRNSRRLTGFLRYIVEQKLAGQENSLKEYSIGVTVFGKSEDFDPRLNAVVRVTARELRSKLNSYYSHCDRPHILTIALDPGDYVPKFLLNRRETHPSSGNDPVHAVIVSDADGMTDKAIASWMKANGYRVSGEHAEPPSGHPHNPDLVIGTFGREDAATTIEKTLALQELYGAPGVLLASLEVDPGILAKVVSSPSTLLLFKPFRGADLFTAVEVLTQGRQQRLAS